MDLAADLDASCVVKRCVSEPLRTGSVLPKPSLPDAAKSFHSDQHRLRSFQCAVLLFLRFELFRQLVDPCDELAFSFVSPWCSTPVPRQNRTAGLSRPLESVQTNREFVNEPFLVVEFRLQDFRSLSTVSSSPRKRVDL